MEDNLTEEQLHAQELVALTSYLGFILRIGYGVNVVSEEEKKRLNTYLSDEGTNFFEKFSWPIIKDMLSEAMTVNGFTKGFMVQHLQTIYDIVKVNIDFPADWPMDPEKPMGLTQQEYDKLLDIVEYILRDRSEFENRLKQAIQG